MQCTTISTTWQSTDKPNLFGSALPLNQRVPCVQPTTFRLLVLKTTTCFPAGCSAPLPPPCDVTHQPAGDAVHHDALRQVHGVGDGDDDKPRVRPARPVEQVVQDVLLPRPEQVQLSRDGSGVGTGRGETNSDGGDNETGGEETAPER